MPYYGSFGLSNAPRAGCANRRFAWRWLAQSATLLTALTLAVSPSMAASTRVAVAANFTEAAQEIAAAFGVNQGYPTTFVIDGEGMIRTKMLGSPPTKFEKLQETVDAALRGLRAPISPFEVMP